MKTKTFYLILLFTIVLVSCESISKSIRQSYSHEMYIDYKYISYKGKNKNQVLNLEIDSTSGIWFYGKLYINTSDTLILKGFEKGNLNKISYKKTYQNESGFLVIRCNGETGQILDSITISNDHPSNLILTEKTVLYRNARKNCD